MKTPINLENTQFVLSEALSVGDWPTVISWDNKGKPVKVADFGTILIGLEKVTDQTELEELEQFTVGDGPVFTVPETWGWPQIARALGFFQSATQARKNGWDGEIEPGWNTKVGRVNKIRGEVVVFRIG